ncbi:hypothetical protein OSG_eHP34_00220 [environmental Halophage eHP-34]|nr:hypothetical protein OSG_eHP34_00220 [environmental Halophage eHP-34]
MPFEYRNFDPVQAARNISETLAALPPYAQTLMGKDLGVSHMAGTEIMEPLLRLYGIVEMTDTSKGRRYKNPHYAHYDACIDPLTDPEARIDFYHKYKHNPFADATWYGKHWGVDSAGAVSFLKRRDISLRHNRLQARKELARSLLTIHRWTDLTQYDLADIMPGTDATVRKWMSDYGSQAEEWQPPERPTHKPWFRDD